jgi:uncharacterized protein YjlB
VRRTEHLASTTVLGGMTVLESAKTLAERVTGLRRPSALDLKSLCRTRKPTTFRFRDDGFVPNNPRWPLIVYRGAVRLPQSFDPAAVMEDMFEGNGWGDTWRDVIYTFIHYHSRIHEVLGVARGTARVQFGGSKGRTLMLKAGDVAIIPAGTGHQSLSASKDFLVVGAYPPFGTYDECRPINADHDRAVKTVPKVRPPRKDPVYGSSGPLVKLWPR